MKLCRNKKEFLTALILLGLVLLVRVIYIPTGRVWFDEVVSITAAKQGLGEIYQNASAETNTPAYYVLLHYYIHFFGDGETTLRALSIFFGLLSGLVIFFLARELTEERLVPQITLFLTAVSPFHLYYSHEIRCYSILIFLSSLSLLCLIKCLRRRTPRNFWDICYAISLVLGAYLHITYLFYILALGFFLLVEAIRQRRRDLLIRNLLFPDVLLVGSIISLYIVGYPVIIGQIKNVIGVRSVVGGSPVYDATTMGDFVSTIVRVYWGEVLVPAVLVLTVLFIYLGLKKLNTKKHISLLFLLILGTSLTSFNFPAASRYVAYTFPAVVILLSFGVRYVWAVLHKIGGREFRINPAIVIVVLLLSSVLSVQATIGLREGGRFCPRQLPLFFEENNFPNAVVLVVPSWERYTLLYYLERSIPVKGVNTNLDEFGCGLSFAEELRANWYPVVGKRNVDNLKNYINGFKNIWYVDSFLPADPERLVLGWLVENTHLEKIYYVDCSECLEDSVRRMPVFLFRNGGV